jgi:hypothetical protein
MPGAGSHVVDEIAVGATQFENGIVSREAALQVGTEHPPQRLTRPMSGKAALKIALVVVRIVVGLHCLETMRQS